MFANHNPIVRAQSAILWGLILLTAGAAHPALGQRYEAIEPKLTYREGRSLGGEVNSAMRNAASYQAGGKEKIEQYYNTFVFPRMTQFSAAALARLGDEREDLIKQLRGANVSAAQTQLTALALNAMRVIAKRNYHPSVRYNAALVLGMLDKEYSNGSSAPVILPEATAQLLELLENDEFEGIKVHPSVKVAALEGLDRHARFGVDQQYRERVTKAALAVAAQEASSLGISKQANNWMRCQAARVLARLYSEGMTSEVLSALNKLIEDEKMSLDDRCRVAESLGMVKFNTVAAGTDSASTVLPLGQLTKAAVTEGAKKAREFEEEVTSGPMDFRRSSRSLSRRGEEGPEFERRPILARLTCIEKAATSVAAGLDAASQQKVQDLVALLKPAIKTISDEKLNLDVTAAVKSLEASVNSAVAGWQPAAAAPAAEAEEVFEEEAS